MKTTEKILLAIKLESDKQTKLAEIKCFDKIAARCGVSVEKLPAYLNELQNQGYIRYSIADNFIYLTKEGQNFIE